MNLSRLHYKYQGLRYNWAFEQPSPEIIVGDIQVIAFQMSTKDYQDSILGFHQTID